MGKMSDHPELTPFAKYLHHKLDECGKTQREIAAAAGFKSPNMLSMIKHGETGIPLERILPLARALDDDPRHLLRLALEGYWPDYRAVIREITGGLVSRNEEAFLTVIRSITSEGNPIFDLARLTAFVKAWQDLVSTPGPRSMM